jgi:NAD(P)-dependent dehydrogenase (short-subunit alcohol dehydrogenase family)
MVVSDVDAARGQAVARSIGGYFNAICPAYVRTPLVEHQIAHQARTRGIAPEQVVEQVMIAPAAIKRLVEPGEVPIS